MSKAPYRPLNLTDNEIPAIKVAIEGLLSSESYHIENSYVGKVGEAHLKNILRKVDRLLGSKDSAPTAEIKRLKEDNHVKEAN